MTKKLTLEVIGRLLEKLSEAGYEENPAWALEYFYEGEFQSLGDYVKTIWEESSFLGDFKTSYLQPLNFDRIGCEMVLKGEIFYVELEGALHVFNTPLDP